jgi:hypothetical protein
VKAIIRYIVNLGFKRFEIKYPFIFEQDYGLEQAMGEVDIRQNILYTIIVFDKYYYPKQLDFIL